MGIIHKDLAYKIVGCAFEVHNQLGYGFLEKVYENALCVALDDVGIAYETQKPINIFFREKLIGNYFADLVVENKIIVELKSAKQIAAEHEAQILNYLTATGIRLGLIINFSPDQLDYKRIIK